MNEPTLLTLSIDATDIDQQLTAEVDKVNKKSARAAAKADTEYAGRRTPGTAGSMQDVVRQMRADRREQASEQRKATDEVRKGFTGLQKIALAGVAGAWAGASRGDVVQGALGGAAAAGGALSLFGKTPLSRSAGMVIGATAAAESAMIGFGDQGLDRAANLNPRIAMAMMQYRMAELNRDLRIARDPSFEKGAISQLAQRRRLLDDPQLTQAYGGLQLAGIKERTRIEGMAYRGLGAIAKTAGGNIDHVSNSLQRLAQVATVAAGLLAASATAAGIKALRSAGKPPVPPTGGSGGPSPSGKGGPKPNSVGGRPVDPLTGAPLPQKPPTPSGGWLSRTGKWLGKFLSRPMMPMPWDFGAAGNWQEQMAERHEQDIREGTREPSKEYIQGVREGKIQEPDWWSEWEERNRRRNKTGRDPNAVSTGDPELDAAIIRGQEEVTRVKDKQYSFRFPPTSTEMFWIRFQNSCDYDTEPTRHTGPPAPLPSETYA